MSDSGNEDDLKGMGGASGSDEEDLVAAPARGSGKLRHQQAEACTVNMNVGINVDVSVNVNAGPRSANT